MPTIFNPPSPPTESLPCATATLSAHQPRLHGSTSTLSSTSSGGSSLRSRLSSLASSSFSSKTSSPPKTPVEFWAQFERNSSQRKSLSIFFKELFFAKPKKEVTEDIYEVPEGDSTSSVVEEGETSFNEAPILDTCPTGLYCVIDDFLSEYELRLFEEEARARLLQKQKHNSKT